MAFLLASGFFGVVTDTETVFFDDVTTYAVDLQGRFSPPLSVSILLFSLANNKMPCQRATQTIFRTHLDGMQYIVRTYT